jgi:hypothetical protein
MAIDFSKLVEKAKAVKDAPKKYNKEDKEKDPRFYETPVNDEGNFLSVVRFVHSDEKNDYPFVEVMNHYVKEKGPDGRDYTFTQLCPTQIKGEKLKCPVCEHNRNNWNNYTDLQKGRQRKTRYYSNILVVKDPTFPEREGKVYLYSYGVKIHKKVWDLLMPDTKLDPTAEPYNIYDYKTGKNFKLKIKTVSGFPNYDDAAFQDPSAVANVDDQIMSLEEFKITNDKLKSYDELKSRWDKFLDYVEGRIQSKAKSSKEDSDGEVWTEAKQEAPAAQKSTPKATTPKPTPKAEAPKNAEATGDEEDFFNFDK